MWALPRVSASKLKGSMTVLAEVETRGEVRDVVVDEAHTDCR